MNLFDFSIPKFGSDEFYQSLLLIGVTAFTASALAFIVATATLIALPSGYFTNLKMDKSSNRHFIVFRTGYCLLKNILGLILFCIGVVMLIAPGPGVLVISISVLLMDIPYKKQFELFVVSKAPIYELINNLRSRFKRPPLTLPNHSK